MLHGSLTLSSSARDSGPDLRPVFTGKGQEQGPDDLWTSDYSVGERPLRLSLLNESLGDRSAGLVALKVSETQVH